MVLVGKSHFQSYRHGCQTPSGTAGGNFPWRATPRHPMAGPIGAGELLRRSPGPMTALRPERRHDGRPVEFLTTADLTPTGPLGGQICRMGPSRTCFPVATELTHLTFKCFHRYLPQALLEILNGCRIARGVARPAPVYTASGRRFHKRGGVTKEGHRCRVRP
jgi:hypothetical protein